MKPALGAIGDLAWAVSSLEELFENGSSEREIFRNAARGIKDRLAWIQSKALAETKRNVHNGRNLTDS